MYLLSGQSLTKADWFRPERMGLNLEERVSTATPTLGPEAPEMTVGAWLLDEEEPGAGIVWRVKTINTQYDTNTRTVALEHICATLKDLVMFGEVKPTDMRAAGSTAPAGECYAAEALAYILSKHSLWTLGTVTSEYSSISNPYNFNGDTLFDALETVTASLEGCYWSFDLSALPFTISFLKFSDDVDSEMRAGRNIRTLRKTVDMSRMYTRFYPIGKNDLHVDGGYVSRNENLYGVIAKVETDQSIRHKSELTRWANERLRKHAEPSVTIQISGLDLSESTGEPLDRFTVNKQCRVPLPEFGTTITEKVTKLSWSDKIGEPESVNVTLANLLEDVASIINNQAKSGGRGGRTAAKDAKEDHAWIEDTEDHVAIIAEAAGGSGIYDGQDINWSRVAALVVDGNGIQQRVTIAQQDATVGKSWVEQNGATVTAGVAKISTLEEKDVELEGRLDLEAGKASLLVTATDNRPVKSYPAVANFPATGSASYLYYAIATKKYYEWKNGAYSETTPGNMINRAGIISTINEDSSSTTNILGDKVLIGFNDQQLTDEDLNTWAQSAKNGTGVFAKFLTVKQLTAQEITTMLANIADASIEEIKAGLVDATSVNADDEVTTYALEATVLAGESGRQNAIDDFVASFSISGNTLTLTRADGTSENFSKATSLSGTWSGSEPKTFTVSASPQGENYYQYFTTGAKQNQDGTAYSSGNEWYVPVLAYGVGAPPSYTQIMRVQVDAGTIWTNGFNAGAPTGVTLGTHISGTVWNMSIGRGNYAAVPTTLDLTNVYSAARAGYYTQAQYDAALATVPAGYFNSANLYFDCTDLGNSNAGNDKPITGTAKNGSTVLGTGTQTIHMGTGSWSGGKIGVTARMSNANGKVITRVYVDMPTSGTWERKNLGTGNQWEIGFTVGGKKYTKNCTAPGGISW